jgi:hypothetical protein
MPPMTHWLPCVQRERRRLRWALNRRRVMAERYSA